MEFLDLKLRNGAFAASLGHHVLEDLGERVHQGYKAISTTSGVGVASGLGGEEEEGHGRGLLRLKTFFFCTNRRLSPRYRKGNKVYTDIGLGWMVV